MLILPNPMRRIIRATARPVIGRPICGKRLDHESILTSKVQRILGRAGGIALAQTQNSWHLVLAPATPQPADGR